MNLALQKVIDSLVNNSSEWEFCTRWADTLEHKSGLSVWMSNVPIFNTNIYKPCKLSLNLYEKYKLHKAAKVCMRNLCFVTSDKYKENKVLDTLNNE